MLSFTAAPTHLLVWPNSSTNLSPHYCNFSALQSCSRKAPRKWEKLLVSLQLTPERETATFLGFLDLRKRNYRDCSWGFALFAERRKKGWESEGDLELEAEILEFMKKNSEKPEAFPSKKQLLDAGRMDLVEGIVRQGGWLAFGWESDDDDNDNESHDNGVLRHGDNGYRDSVKNKESNHSVIEQIALEGNDDWGAQDSLFRVDSYLSASSSGRSIETRAQDDSGVEGILNRLEKERNMNLGFGMRERVAGLKMNKKPRSFNPENGIVNNAQDRLGPASTFSSIDGLKNSLKPDMWRTWSIQRAGNSDMEFEADEIASYATRIGYNMDDLGDEILQVRDAAGSSSNRMKKNSSCEGSDLSDIRSRLQHLEVELSSVLKTLKSNSSYGAFLSDNENSELSNALEFQQNEIMNTQGKLRSMRAKLAVLEGKMTLAIIDAQKQMEEKQERIDDTRRALRLLRTACIVWPNSASEVLLTGSFDNWATKRRMDKSNSGVFSLYLKLYPGRYEIKFIVDGEWRIDPLRPIVNNNGFENNLLIIT